MINRRSFLKTGGIAGVAGFLSITKSAYAGRGGMGGSANTGGSALNIPVFEVPLAIPPELKPINGRYELTQTAVDVEIIPGTTTQIWGYNGITPGPTIRVDRDQPVVVRQTNNLTENVTTHLHGGHVTGNNDGHPTDYINPGSSKDYYYPNNQLPTTLWYHDHTMDHTGPHVYMGLAGFYIIEDDFERSLNLPSGEFEIPLVIQDRTFASDASLVYSGNINGETGDTLLVNGTPYPFFEVGTRKYRFRILNGSNARGYEFALSNGQDFIQIGTDGGLLGAPMIRNSFMLSPAERADVVIDFSNASVGDEIILQNLLGSGSTAEIMRFNVTRAESDDSVVPNVLRPIEILSPADSVATRSFVFSRTNSRTSPWVINGRTYDANRIDASPVVGTTEIWELSNRSNMIHPVHLHDIMWQVVDVNGQPPGDAYRGWKDTFQIPPNSTIRVIGRFDDYTSTGEYPYVFHCHNLEHEDHEMMAQFEVTA